MLFKEISPFIRYARYMSLQMNVSYPLCIPYDARLFYAQKGNSSILADGVEYQMKPGTVLVINSGVEYQILPDSENDIYIALNFDYTQDFEHNNAPVPPAHTPFILSSIPLSKYIILASSPPSSIATSV